jgi:hypothetical protein
MESDDIIIEQTKAWINNVVIGCNFCPFAARELKRGSIHFEVIRSKDVEKLLMALSAEFDRLDNDASVETTFIILPEIFSDFNDYLDMIAQSEMFLEDQGYEGIYQIASFHPDYIFQGSGSADPANYTNRSLYPMIHLLRESSITEALSNFPNPETIPQRNIDFARQKGLAHMRMLQKLSRS